jgi:hypothetical protein
MVIIMYSNKKYDEGGKTSQPVSCIAGSKCTVKKMTETLVVAGREIGLEVNGEKT